MNLTSASTFRRMACGLCLIAGAVMLLLANVLDPLIGSGREERDIVEALKDDPEMAQLSTALYVFGFALVAIGIIGVVHVIRGRGVVLANLGGALALLGLILFTALSATTVNQIVEAEHLELDTAVSLSEDIQDYWVAYVVVIPALAGTLIGFLLLAVAVVRSGLAHEVAGVLIVLGSLVVTASDEARVVAVVAGALLLAGWGLVALRLLGLTDEQWEGRAPLRDGPPPAPPPAAT
jgi:hypothetical protein